MLCWFLFFSFFMAISLTALLFFIGSDQSVATFNWIWSTVSLLCIRFIGQWAFGLCFYLSIFFFFNFVICPFIFLFQIFVLVICAAESLSQKIMGSGEASRITVSGFKSARKLCWWVQCFIFLLCCHFYCLKNHRFLYWCIWYWIFCWPNLWFILGLSICKSELSIDSEL